MKKFLLGMVAVLFSFTMAFGNCFAQRSAQAVSGETYNTFSTEINSILSDYVKFNDRIAGSEMEEDASKYILEYLSKKTNLTAFENNYITGGVQKFDFYSTISDKMEKSQNIIYVKKSVKENAKKLIFTCNYDAIAFEYIEEEYTTDLAKTEGINTSAGSVALMLVLAREFGSSNLDFDVEFCFFGAGESDNAGARIYSQGITTEAKDKILGVINFEKVALGKNLYFYTDEIETTLSKYIEDFVSDNKLSVKKVNTVHLSKGITSQDELGLGYTHVALQSANVVFMKQGINAINIFAGEYEDGIEVGLSEFSGKEILTYTTKDNAETIDELYGFDTVTRNLYNVFDCVTKLCIDDEFISVLESNVNETKWFYAIFANDKLALLLTIIAFVVLVLVCMYEYMRLNIKSYYADVETEFFTSVLKISDQVDKTGEDENVSKMVSQVIAQDIKKNKTIKSEKKKKK